MSQSAQGRTVRHDSRFIVSDDPENVLGALFDCFLDTPFSGEAATRFAPDGAGLGVPDTIAAFRANAATGDWGEIPPDKVPDDLSREWWIVMLYRWRESPVPAVVIIEGEELRKLLRAAGLM